MYNEIFNECCFQTMSKMSDKFVDFSFTSPPYNRKRNDKYTHYDDNISNYYDFLNQVVFELLRVTKKYVFLNIQTNYYNKTEVYSLIGLFSKQIAEVFIWEKSNPMPASGFALTNAYEYIICFGDRGLKSNKTYTKNHLTTSVARMPKEHKAVMHQDVANFFIQNFTKPGEVIYDPFIGIGTTAKACKNLGRIYIGSEIIKEYFDYSVKQLNTNDNKKSPIIT